VERTLAIVLCQVADSVAKYRLIQHFIADDRKRLRHYSVFQDEGIPNNHL
jgi:hypothetical protein